MNKKVGRNDPCPCGSNKKYKNCCFSKDKGPKKISAKVIKSGLTPRKEGISNLMERAFGNGMAKALEEDVPPVPEESFLVDEPEEKSEETNSKKS